tara:strand:+ start:166 stop:753 length:588 start_codon:yes stop_codon:yes gene_type:complete
MKTKQTNIRLEVGLRQWYDDLGEREERDAAFFMRKALEQYRDGFDVKPVKSSAPAKVAKPVNQYDELFDIFWSAGMRKASKPAARKAFEKVIRKAEDPEQFTYKLVDDIQKRISIDQLGFTELHPATYLNGMRWEDDHKAPNKAGLGYERKQSLCERSTAAAEDIFAKLEASENGHGALGHDDAPIRLQVDRKRG